MYVHYISVEHFQVRFLGDKQLRKAIVLVYGYGLRPQVVLVPPPPAPPPLTQVRRRGLQGAAEAEVGCSSRWGGGRSVLLLSRVQWLGRHAGQRRVP